VNAGRGPIACYAICMQPWAWKNGVWLPARECHIGFDDAGFVWGATVTDQCRTFRHRLFDLEAHVERFLRSAELACIPVPYSFHDLVETAQELVSRNAHELAAEEELCLILAATPGPIEYYSGPRSSLASVPTMLMHTYPLPWRRYVPLLRYGAVVLIPRVRSVPSACLSPTIKHRSRLHWWIAQTEVRRRDPEALALLLDETGRLTETALANFHAVIGATVVSPPQEVILPGLSRKRIRDLCTTCGLTYCEKPLTQADLSLCSEAFLSNSIFCLAPVRRIEDHAYPCPGPVYQMLRRAFSELVGLDFVEQILGHAT